METAIALGAGEVAVRLAETADNAVLGWWLARVAGALRLAQNRDGHLLAPLTGEG